MKISKSSLISIFTLPLIAMGGCSVKDFCAKNPKLCTFPIPSPTPSSTPAPSPSPTAAPSPSPSPIESPSPSPIPSPSPTSIPTAPPTPTPSRTSTIKIIMLDYGGDCKQKGVRFTYKLGCKEALVTATPKEGENGHRPDGSPCTVPNCDAPDHTYNIEWAIGTACDTHPDKCVWFVAQADAGPFLITENGGNGFNMKFIPKSRGSARVWVKLTEPQGPYLQARDVTIQ